MSQIQSKLHAKRFCRCKYRGDYAAAFCVFGPLFCECQNVIHIREKFWDFVANKFSIELEVELHNLTDIAFVYSLFGANLIFFLNQRTIIYIFEVFLYGIPL